MYDTVCQFVADREAQESPVLWKYVHLKFWQVSTVRLIQALDL